MWKEYCAIWWNVVPVRIRLEGLDYPTKVSSTRALAAGRAPERSVKIVCQKVTLML